MTKEDLIDRVNFVLGEGHKELQLFGFVAGDDSPYRIGITDALESELISVVASGVETLIVDKEYAIVNYSTSDERRDRYYRYDLEEKPERMANMSFVIGNHGVGRFDLNHHQITEINTLIILVSDGQGRAFTVYKYLSPVEKVVKSTKTLLAKIGIGDNVLEEEQQPLLRISPKFQVIYSERNGQDGEYVFLESSFVETNFNLNQILDNQANRDISIIERTNLLKDVEKLQQYSQKTSFSRKLVGVMKSSKVIRENISKERILEFIVNDEGLRNNLKIAEVNGERFIDITSQKSAKCFLDLLNDEFLYSRLTGQEYHAVDKDER